MRDDSISNQQILCRKLNPSQFFLIFLFICFFSSKLFADPIFRINTGTNQSIDKYGTCRKIINASGKDIMVPTGTSAEWLSFVNNANIAGVTKKYCFDIGTGFNAYVQAIAIQPDGKIIVGGNFTSFNGTTQNRITRLNTDGTIDTGFTIGTGFDNLVYDIAIQSDGKIIVGGSFTSFNGTTQNRITRLNTDGTIDTGFTIGTGFDGSVMSIALQSDHQIVVGGSFLNLNGLAQKRLARLNTNGTRDTVFATNLGTGFDSTVYGVSIHGSGKIIVVGQFSSFNGNLQNRIVQLNTDGTRDTNFGGTGFTGFAASTVKAQNDSKSLVGGNITAYNGTTQNYMARVNADGSLDTGFTIGTGASSYVYKYASADAFATIFFVGLMGAYNGFSSRVIKINNDGSRDTSFSAVNLNSWVNAIAIQSDGKIVVGGNFTSFSGISQNYITRINANGTMD